MPPFGIAARRTIGPMPLATPAIGTASRTIVGAGMLAVGIAAPAIAGITTVGECLR